MNAFTKFNINLVNIFPEVNNFYEYFTGKNNYLQSLPAIYISIMMTRGYYGIFAVCLLVLGAFFCATLGGHKSDVRALKEAPARKLSSYRFNPSSALIDRYRPIPDFLLEDLKKLDGRDDYRCYSFTATEKKELARYLDLLPPRYAKVLRERLVSIYAVSPFMGAGLADWVMDENGKMYAIMVINPEVMKKTLSEWLTYRERSCFKNDNSGVEVSVDAGGTYSALMYYLLHEAAHIVDYVENHTPYVEELFRDISKFSIADRPFVQGVWWDYAKPESSKDFPMRELITFYGLSKGPKIALSKAKELYDGFSKSHFVSLYASQSWAEDFAETAMIYHLTQKLKQPYAIYLTKDGKEIFRLRPADSRNIIQRFEYIKQMY